MDRLFESSFSQGSSTVSLVEFLRFVAAERDELAQTLGALTHTQKLLLDAPTYERLIQTVK